MRTWTLVAAGLVAATVGATASVLPDTQPAVGQQEQKKKAAPTKPADDDAIVRDIQRHVQVFGGRDVQIGVAVRDLEGDEARATSGAVISDVREDSPAAKAGFKDGDIIVEFDAERVRSARHLSRIVDETAPGRAVKAVVERDGRRVELQVTPEAGMARSDGEFRMHPLPGKGFAFNAPNFTFDSPEMHGLLEEHGRGGPDVLIVPPGRGRLGIGIQDLSPQLADYFGATNGVLVTTVESDSPAGRAGLKAGDVITAIGGTEVSSPADLTHAVRRAEDGSELSITYMRDKKKGTATAKLETRERELRRKGEPI